MKLKLLAASLFLIAFSSQTAIAADTNNAMMLSNPTTNSSNQNTQTQDAGTLGWLMVLNKNEIIISETVLNRKKLNPMVMGYAKYLVQQHTQLLNDTLRLSKKIKTKPVQTEDALTLKKEGESGMASLKSLDDVAFQKTYIDAMVTGHMQALAALKADIQNEHNAALKKLLIMTKKHIAMHLEKAKEIQKKLNA